MSEEVIGFVKRFVAGCLKLGVLSALFIGSCVGPGTAYYSSAKWFLDDVDPSETSQMYIAFIAEYGDEASDTHVYRYGADLAEENFRNVQYLLPEYPPSRNWSRGETRATISVLPESDESQIVQVFMVGDTPWSSLSEYRVRNNEIYPLKYARSNLWFLLGAFVGPIIVGVFLRKLVVRLIDRLMGIQIVETKNASV